MIRDTEFDFRQSQHIIPSTDKHSCEPTYMERFEVLIKSELYRQTSMPFAINWQGRPLGPTSA